MRIGIDDTDGPSGGCTTYAMTELLRVASEASVDLLGEPRLVRLNPNVPWKTRGNAALSASFGHGVGRARPIGRLGRRPIVAYPRGHELSEEARRDFLEAAWRAVRAASVRGPRTSPAMVAAVAPLPESLYWQAVRSVVRLGEVRAVLREAGAVYRTEGGSRGLVGAAAAVAWPARRRTFELIAYRSPDRGAEPREVDAASVARAARRFPSLFLCDDPRTGRLLVTPHTGCPVLFGLRARRPETLPQAARIVRSERPERWVLFRSNQATGDHLVARAIGEIAPYEPAMLEGTVAGAPERLAGGHVRFTLGAPDGRTVDCLVFEPTKTLTAPAARLREGDRVVVWGGRGFDASFRVEGLRPRHLVRRALPPERPLCRACGRRARSRGAGRGYRCEGCRRLFPPEAARPRSAPPGLRLVTYHPTPSARRHLHPLEGRRFPPTATPL